MVKLPLEVGRSGIDPGPLHAERQSRPGHRCEMEESTGRSESPFDLDATLQRMGGDLDLFVRVVEFFMDDNGPLLAQIEVGIGQANAKTVEQAAHSLKGLLANFSADDGVRAAARLEEAGRNAQFAEAPAMLEQLKVELARLGCELQAYLPPQPEP